MKMIRIEKINWLSTDAKEAEVYLSDGNFNITAFSHPFNQNVGEKIIQPLYALNARDIYRQHENVRFSILRKPNSFEHKLSGKILDISTRKVGIGEFIVVIDIPLPGDIENGDYVSFICDRIDIY